MIDREALINDFYSIERDFPYLFSINLYRNFEDDMLADYSLDIVLCDDPPFEEKGGLLLRFGNVRDFEIGEFTSFYLHPLILITDISSHQLEGIHFQVTEDEESTFTFYCRTFEFEVIESRQFSKETAPLAR
jgi:hypothetical protein